MWTAICNVLPDTFWLLWTYSMFSRTSTMCHVCWTLMFGFTNSRYPDISSCVLERGTASYQHRISGYPRYNSPKVIPVRRLSAVPTHHLVKVSLFRPPGTVVQDGLLFHRRCFLGSHISEVPGPIAAKLCHTIGIWLKRSRKFQQFGGVSPKKTLGAKTCKISVDFLQRPTLIANISGTA